MVTLLPMPPRKADVRPKVIVNARIDADALDKLDELAEADRRSRSEMIDFAVQAYVAQHYPPKHSRR